MMMGHRAWMFSVAFPRCLYHLCPPYVAPALPCLKTSECGWMARGLLGTRALELPRWPRGCDRPSWDGDGRRIGALCSRSGVARHLLDSFVASCLASLGQEGAGRG